MIIQHSELKFKKNLEITMHSIGTRSLFGSFSGFRIYNEWDYGDNLYHFNKYWLFWYVKKKEKRLSQLPSSRPRISRNEIMSCYPPPPAQLTVETKWQRDNFCGKIFLCLHFFKYLFRQQQAIKHFCISFVVDYTHAFFLCCELFVCFCVRTCLYPRLNVTCDRLVY